MAKLKYKKPREVTVDPTGDGIRVFMKLEDLTDGEQVMSFSADYVWRWLASLFDPDQAPKNKNDDDDLNDFEALIKLDKTANNQPDKRAAKYPGSMLNIVTTATSLIDDKKTHKYKVTFTVRQGGKDIDVWSTKEREFKGFDTFVRSYMFVH